MIHTHLGKYKKNRLSISIVFCFIASTAFSQIRIETATELKLNLATSLLLYPEIHYEQVRTSEYISFVKSDFFGYGFSAGHRISGFKSSDEPEYGYDNFPRIYANNFHLLAFCRLYFNLAQKFHYHYDLKRPVLYFIEPTAAIVGFDDYTTLFLGIGGGIKLINVMNYTAELYFAGGTSLRKYEYGGEKFYEKYYGVGYYRFGINLGWRFT